MPPHYINRQNRLFPSGLNGKTGACRPKQINGQPDSFINLAAVANNTASIGSGHAHDNIHKAQLNASPSYIRNALNLQRSRWAGPSSNRDVKNLTNAQAFRQRLVNEGDRLGARLAQIMQNDWGYATACAVLFKAGEVGFISHFTPAQQLKPLSIIIANLISLEKNQRIVIFEGVERAVEAWSRSSLPAPEVNRLRGKICQAISRCLPVLNPPKRAEVIGYLVTQLDNVARPVFQTITYNIALQQYRLSRQVPTRDRFRCSLEILSAANACIGSDRLKIITMLIDNLACCSDNRVNSFIFIIIHYIFTTMPKIERIQIEKRIDHMAKIRGVKFQVIAANHRVVFNSATRVK